MNIFEKLKERPPLTLEECAVELISALESLKSVSPKEQVIGLNNIVNSLAGYLTMKQILEERNGCLDE